MMRLDKFFSEQKILSRKEVADKIKKGCICVNGTLAKKADIKIDEQKDVITLDGQIVAYLSATPLFRYSHKRPRELIFPQEGTKQ